MLFYLRAIFYLLDILDVWGGMTKSIFQASRILVWIFYVLVPHYNAFKARETLRWDVSFVRLTILFYLHVFVQQKRRAKRLSICQLLKCTARSLRSNSRKESGQESMSIESMYRVVHVSRGKQHFRFAAFTCMLDVILRHFGMILWLFALKNMEPNDFFGKENCWGQKKPLKTIRQRGCLHSNSKERKRPHLYIEKDFKKSQQYQRRFGVVIQCLALRCSFLGLQEKSVQRLLVKMCQRIQIQFLWRHFANEALIKWSKYQIIKCDIFSCLKQLLLLMAHFLLKVCSLSLSTAQVPIPPEVWKVWTKGEAQKHRSFFITTPCNFGTLRTQWHTLWSLLWTRRRDGWDTWDTWLTQLHRLRIHNPVTTFHEVPSMAWDSAKKQIENEKVKCHSLMP